MALVSTTSQSGRRSPAAPIPFNLMDLVCAALIALVSLAAVGRYWQPGIPNLGDMLMGVYRIFLLEQDWRYGLYYPRIATDLNFGYGAPLFEYYAPLASIGGVLLRLSTGIGYVTAAKAMSTLTMMVAGWGAYGFARFLLRDRVAACVAAVAFVFAPYLLLTLYERGAAAELLGLALMPWTLWAYHGLLVTPTRRGTLRAAGVTALLMLAHNITALFVIPLALIWVFLHAWHSREWRRLLPIGGAALLGLGLTAFYWLPAIGEIGYVEFQQSVLDEFLSVNQHLKELGELVQRTFFFDYWGETRFQFALGTLILGILGGIGAFMQRPPLRFSLLLLTLAWLVIQILQLNVMLPFWTAVPLIEFVQFPWRLYGVASLAVALLTGGLLTLATGRGERILIGGALLFLAVAPGVQNADPVRSPLWFPVEDQEITIKDLYLRGRQGFSLFTDYTPNDLGVSSHELSQPRPSHAQPLPPLPTVPTIQVLKENPSYQALQVQAAGPWTLRLHRAFFPGWQIYVDGAAVPTTPDDRLGLAHAEIPAGSHFVEAKFDQTPLRAMADLISWVALAIGGVLLAASLRGPRWWRLLAGLAIVALILAMPALLRAGRDRAAHVPAPLATQFGRELHLLGYDLPSSPWLAGTTIPVRLYWLASETPATDYKIFIHVARLDDSGREGQSDEQPRLGFSPMSRWEPGEVIVDQQEIKLDADIPPGRYRVVMGVYDPATVTNLPASGGDSYLPGDRLLLTEIELVQSE